MGRFDKDIAQRRRMEEYVADRNQAVNLIEHAHKALNEADSILRACGTTGLPWEARPHSGSDTAIHRLDAMLWRTMFDRTGLSRLMDAEAVAKFHESLDRNPPAFTIENIQSEVLSMHQQADVMFARGVYNVFRLLDSAYRSHSNEPFRIPEKIIVHYLSSVRWGGGFEVNYHRSSLVNDLDRVLKVLDKQPYQPRELEGRINGAWHQGEPYEDDYLWARAHKNGNGHIRFKRPDLLEHINDLIAEHCGGNALAQGRAA